MEETILLNFEIDQTQAQKQLVQTEKNILSLKRQQADLNKEYKAGKIEEDEYVKSNLALQKAVKKESDQKQLLNKLLAVEANSRGAMRARIAELNKEWDKLNTKTETGKKRSAEITKELEKLNAELNKGSKAAGQFKDNIGNYPEQLAKATEEVKPFGVSVNSATQSMSKFLNPATAAIGVLAGLATAYASSSAGAKDLAFAQDRLTFFTQTLTERLGELASGDGENGDGVLNKTLDLILKYGRAIPFLGQQIVAFELLTGKSVDTINEQSKAFAQAREELRKLEIEAARAGGFAKFYEKAAEDARRIRDDEEKILEERLKASNAVEENLTANRIVRVNVLTKEIEAIKKANVNWQNQDAIVLQIEQKRAEVRDIEEEINGKLTENFTTRKKIVAEIIALANAERRQRTPSPDEAADPLQGAFATQLDTEAQMFEDFQKRITQTQEDYSNERIRQKRREAEARIALEQHVRDSTLDITAGFFSVAASLFDQQSEAYKTFATFETLISTYSTAQKAYEAAFVPPTVASPGLGTAYAALAVAQGLARVAQIHGVQFAEGGYTGPGTKWQPAGIVHAGEVVWSQKDVAMAGGPAAANALRPTAKIPGYADGGFVTNQNIAATQQAMIMANAVKNMPAPVVGVVEITRTQQRVKARENLARI